MSEGERDLVEPNWTTTPTGSLWPDSVPSLPGVLPSHLGLFRHLKCIVDLDAEIPYGAFELDVP